MILVYPGSYTGSKFLFRTKEFLSKNFLYITSEASSMLSVGIGYHVYNALSVPKGVGRWAISLRGAYTFAVYSD